MALRMQRHELGQTLGDGEGQGSLACCSPWDRKELDVMATEQHRGKTSVRERWGFLS